MRACIAIFIEEHEQKKTQLQEAGWSPYPTFEELHQILYRAELNIYENFNMPPGITVGDDGSHVNDKTIEMVKKLIDRPPKFIVEASLLPRLIQAAEVHQAISPELSLPVTS